MSGREALESIKNLMAKELLTAIAALEAQRATLGDAVVDTMIAAAQEKLEELEPPPSEQQRKQVTVLFMDVVGSTRLTQGRDPEEVVEIIGGALKHLAAPIKEHGGQVTSYMGDGFQAVFGIPAAQENDPERAIRAGLGILEAARKYAAELKATRGLAGFDVRVGINTGLVIVGGDTEGRSTVTGLPVNLGARMEQAAPPGGLLISHYTYRHVRGIFNVEPREPVEAKGFPEPVPVYLVRGVKPRAFHFGMRGVEGVETRMIGRQAELRHLQDTLYAVMEGGKRQMVTVVGGAGIGKSRLLYEFEVWFELLPETFFYFKGRGRRETQNVPYALIRDLFFFRFQIQDSDPVQIVREKMEQGFSDAFEEYDPGEASLLRSQRTRTQLGAVRAQLRAHFIGQMVGFDFSNSPHLQDALDDPKQIRDRGTIYIGDYFKAMAGRQPVLILLEDLHWADDGSLDVLNRLALAIPDCPLLIVGLARPALLERRPHWGEGQTFHTRLELHPLSKHYSRRLVGEILQKVGEVPVALRELVVGSAEGNPFYIEELIKMLIEDSVIVKGEDRWRVLPARLTQVRVPPTLTGVLQARLDSLPQKERTALQCASVVGRTFWDDAVQALRAGPETNGTAEILTSLCQRELVFQRETSAFTGAREYIFKHALLHEATYESVLKRHRREYHAQVAAWLIARSGERVGEYAGLVAEHYERAGKTEQAGEWYGRAGKQAQATYAPEEAIGYYQKALAFLPETAAAAKRVELYAGLGEMLHWRARFLEAMEAYAAMLEAAEEVGDVVAQARAWTGLSWVQNSLGEIHASLGSAGRAEELARLAGAQVELARALYILGAVYQFGDAEAVLSLGEQILAISSELGARREMGNGLNLLGIGYNLLGHSEQAAHCFGEALSLFRELGDREREGTMLHNLGETAYKCGDYRAAVAIFQETLAIVRGMRARHREIECFNFLGGAQVGLGEYAAAESNLRQAIHMIGPEGHYMLSETHRFLAEACLGQGRVEEALTAAQMALALGRETARSPEIGAAWRTLGMVAAKLLGPISIEDRPCNAPACFAESRRIFTETGIEGDRARTLREWARYELEQGDGEQGKAMWQEAREIFARLGMGLEVERMGEEP